MIGVVIIIISMLILFLGIRYLIEFNKLDNHKPFREVDLIEYVSAGVCAWICTPFGAFGVIAGVVLLILLN